MTQPNTEPEAKSDGDGADTDQARRTFIRKQYSIVMHQHYFGQRSRKV